MAKKILCLVIPSLGAGGMERVMAELAASFCIQEDLEVHLVLYGKDLEIFYKLPSDIKIHKPKAGFDDKKRIKYTIGRLIYLRCEVKKIKPHSVLSFGEYWNSFVLISLFGLPNPVYISDRCSPEKKYSRHHAFLRSLFYPRAKGIIAQTEKTREIYHRQFKHSNIRVIGNPIRSISVTKDKDRENIVLMVGRLIYTKHQDRLIRLFLELAIPGWRLFLIGYDHLNQENFKRLQTLIDLNHASDKVILLGKQRNVDFFINEARFLLLHQVLRVSQTL